MVPLNHDLLNLVAGYLDVDDQARAACVCRDFRQVMAPLIEAFADELRTVLTKAALGGEIETLHSACLPGASWLVYQGTPKRMVMLVPTTDPEELKCTMHGVGAHRPLLSACAVLGPPRIMYDTVHRLGGYEWIAGFRVAGGTNLPPGAKFFLRLSAHITL